MSDNKKDLTRIEDLGEYIHELNQEDEEILDSSSELPDLPSEDNDFSSNFGEEEAPSFNSEEAFGGEETLFENTDNAFASEENTFGSTDETFGTENLAFNSEDISFASEETTFTSEEPGLSEESSEFPSDPSSFDEPEPSFSASLTEEPEVLSQDENAIPVTSEEEFLPDEEPITEPEPTPVYQSEPTQTYKAPETFEDLKKFAESSSFTGMGAEGNPSFSVLVKNVRYIEDVNDILTLLKELKLMSDSEEQVKNRLMRGHLLVPRISEYAAIFLAHKLRRFDIDIQVGLSDEIHPPKHQEAPETGIVSKFNLYQNQTHHFHFDDPKLELSQIIIAATPSLEGHQVIRYIGVASEHKMLDGHIVEDEASEEVPLHYSELAQKLKAHALKAHANAVVGLNYQLTPMPSEYGISGHKYRLTCTGNLVWVNKL